MNIILLRSRLSPEEMQQLHREFPQYIFLSLEDPTYALLVSEYWERAEIIYGAKLTKQELESARQLRWIHCPTDQLNRLCLEDIQKRENVLLTRTANENVLQVGEFVIGVVLAFAKNLFAWWQELEGEIGHRWDSKARDTLWTLKKKVFLQIGLGKTGTEITRQAKQQGMHIIGLSEKKSFHPWCDATGTYDQAVTFLPQADVVCLILPTSAAFFRWLDATKISCLKRDSILIILGGIDVLEEAPLCQAMLEEKLRGVWIDAPFQKAPPSSSKIWKTPGIQVTPEIAPRPRKPEKQSFHLFRYNLRQYIHGNFHDMQGLVTKTHR